MVRGILEKDPTTHFSIRKYRVSNVVALNEEELTRLIFAAAVRDQRRGYALLLTLALGARRSEVAGIEPADDHGDRVYLRQTKFGKPRWVEVNALVRAAIDGLQPSSNGTILGGVKPSTVSKSGCGLKLPRRIDGDWIGQSETTPPCSEIR